MKGKSLLLVDDEPTIRNSLSRELVDAGLEVTLAASGEEAIARINTGCFDLVMTDLLMPGLDGFQVLKAAKQKDLQTMVIILTGYGNKESAIDALRLGADDFLEKPCDTEELILRMSNCLRKQELQKKITMYENFLPVCSYCKKIRDDQQGEHGKGSWYSLEDYFSKTKGVRVSHGCCPECYAEQMEHLSWEGGKDKNGIQQPKKDIIS
ncbi:MAG: response regulator [Spirochaetaceae bacterium]|nr:MAG: response regulator [Spirochaetaceae bacterium]